MLKKILFLAVFAITFVSCQFSETMVLNEDGSGRMSLAIDMSEMIAMMPTTDSTRVKTDTIMSFKSLFEEKKDSIAQLPEQEQKRLKLLENYQMRMVMDPETSEMSFDIFTEFKSVAEANNLMEGLNASDGLDVSPMGNKANPKEEKKAMPQPTGVRFSFEKNVFKRDAYIKDEKAFQNMLDSVQAVELFMDETMYSVKYTFPKKIKSISIENAEISADGKTVTFQKPFVAYMKNPDELDVEIILEEN